MFDRNNYMPRPVYNSTFVMVRFTFSNDNVFFIPRKYIVILGFKQNIFFKRHQSPFPILTEHKNISNGEFNILIHGWDKCDSAL